ncbi:MAG TPA: acyltransferase family protein [Candidatus Limnocylindrales bacterium]
MARPPELRPPVARDRGHSSIREGRRPREASGVGFGASDSGSNANPRPTRRAGSPALEGFRPDLQGLRAVAVLLVLGYHLWPGTVTGGFVGVDVFFVISGFLITGHLLEHPPRRPRHLLEFWGRRIRRLLPAAFLVLAVTAIASRIIAPETRWASNAAGMIASALYVQNWLLASNSVDYLAAAEPPTPVQHYWSLSVEEQFYLVWPLLILAVFWLATRVRLGPWLIARASMLAAIVLSLSISITATAADPASAFFITPTRIWELGVGGLVATLPALGAVRLQARGAPRRASPWVPATAWIGLGMLLVAAWTFSGDTPFPGIAAALPVAGTALVILAAANGPRSPTRLLRLRPVQHLGDTSYSIYLWHWPIIVLWPYAFGEIGPIGAVVIIALTIGLATVTKRYVEDPFRFAPRFQPLVPTFRFAVVGMVVLSIVGGAQLFEAQTRLDAELAVAAAQAGDGSGQSAGEPASEPPGSTAAPGATQAPGSTTTGPSGTPGPTGCYGAASIVRGFDVCRQDPAGRMVPTPLIAATDHSDVYADGCWNYAPFATQITCTYGTGKVKVALVGNSHAGQWLPALQVLAKQHGWTITTYLASQCNATDAQLQFYSAAKSAGCINYGRWVLSQTSGSAYALVVTSERQSVVTLGDGWPQTRATATAGYTTYLQKWAAGGTNLVILHDTTYPGIAIPDCLAAHPSNQAACAGTPDSWSAMDPLYDAATALALPNVTLVDPRPYLCTATVCPAVIGTVIVYFDASHLTATYARSLAPFVGPVILEALSRGG